MSPPLINRIELAPVHVPFRESVREVMAGSEGGLGVASAVQVHLGASPAEYSADETRAVEATG